MDSPNNGGVSTENLLALIGAKEVRIQMLEQQNARLAAALEQANKKLAEVPAPTA